MNTCRMYERAMSRARRMVACATFETAIKLGVIGGAHLFLIGMLTTSALRPQQDANVRPLDVRVIEDRPLDVRVIEDRPLAAPVKPKRVSKPVSQPAVPAAPAPVMAAAAQTTAAIQSIAPAPQPSVPVPVKAETPSEALPAQAVAAPVVKTTPPRFDASYLRNPAPAYPRASRLAGHQGQVVLKVLVNGEGAATNVQVQRSSGFTRLDDAALDAVKHWRFVPAKRGSESIEDWVLVPIAFRLDA